MTTTYWTSSGAGNYTSGTFLSGIFTRSGSNSGSRTITLQGSAATLTVGASVTLVFNTSTVGTGVYDGTVTYNSVQYPIILLNGTAYVLDISLAAGSYPVSGAVICYLRGTRIMTTAGEAAVEDLRPGDMLITRFGPVRPVKWIGRQSFNGHFLGHKYAPVCFHAGSIAPGVPARDLYVSPDHSMVIDGRLVLARLLVTGATITQQATAATVDYFHVDLGAHDCIIAEGAWSESYAAQDNRAAFHNAGEFDGLFPDEQAQFQGFCLPQVRAAGPELDAILAKLTGQDPGGSFTGDADLHLMADGTRIDPSVAGGGRGTSRCRRACAACGSSRARAARLRRVCRTIPARSAFASPASLSRCPPSPERSSPTTGSSSPARMNWRKAAASAGGGPMETAACPTRCWQASANR